MIEKTIGQVTRSNVADDCRRIGIEIEVEGCTNKGDVKRWTVKKDDSLRTGGMEFITDPIKLSEVSSHLTEFYRNYQAFSYKSNARTGIHVHIDSRDCKIINVAAIATAYALAEPALFSMVGDDREENIYCVPWYRADSDVVHLCRIFRSFTGKDPRYAKKADVAVEGMRRSLCKYSGLYLEPLHRFGTVEFRHAPTWKLQSQTDTWVRTCYRLVAWAATRTPAQVLSAYNAGTPRQFIIDVLKVAPPVRFNDLVDDLDTEVLAEALAEPFDSSKVSDSGKWNRVIGKDTKLPPDKGMSNKVKYPAHHPLHQMHTGQATTTINYDFAAPPQPFDPILDDDPDDFV